MQLFFIQLDRHDFFSYNITNYYIQMHYFFIWRHIMEKIIRRDYYLDKIIRRKQNGLIKVVTGIRRCGKSFLLRTLFRQHLLDEGVDETHIIEMAFDLYSNKKYRDPAVFEPWAKQQITDEGVYYLLLDEVQLLGEFESVLNEFADMKNVDVYVTGSNAKFLSKDIITEFGGRSDEIHMYPLSFSEFMSIYNGNKYDGWNEYITFGGIPLVVLADDEEQKIAILQNLFSETYLQDIKKRYKIKSLEEMNSLLDFLSSSIGSLTNPNKLVNTFKSVKKSKITQATVGRYLDHLEDSYLIESAQRYDIKGKAYLETPLKYYFMDLGLRNVRLNFRQQEPSHSMENVLYIELRMRGFSVDVGNVCISERNSDGRPERRQLEVDFVCNKGSKRYYIQSAYRMDSEEKIKQEQRPLRKIDDGFRKLIITSDSPKPTYNEEGILTMNVYDFLLHPEYMDY